MACNSCTKTFSLLRKEKGCPSCGFSYCSKCLSYKIFLPKINADTKVCGKCKRLAGVDEKKEFFAPPDAYYKRLAVTEEKLKNQEIQERLQNLKKDKDLSNSVIPSEEEIAKRLQSIKGATPISTEELQARLAKLRDLPNITSQNKPLPAPDIRTEQEQADDLMKQYLEQVKIDAKYKDNFDAIINDIESRVQNLKETSGPSEQNISEKKKELSDSEDEDYKKIIERVKAQSLLEHNENMSSKTEELPFCEICNEDARMRCLGCRYLFCKQCFLEHKDDEDGCDSYEPYTPPSSG